MAQIGETELDVRTLADALRRQVWLLALIALVGAFGTYVGLSFVSPLYTADTRILIEERESPLTRTRDDTTQQTSDFDESAIQSQVEVLKSREIADAVIDKLDLTHRPEFDPARRPSVLRSLLVMVGLSAAPTDSSIRQRVMDAYFDRLSVNTLQKSRVIGIEFSAPTPELAAEVADAIAASFVTLQQDAKRQSAVAATDWLQQEIERLRGRVAEAEQAVADYRTKHGLFQVEQTDGSQGGNLSTQQLGDINAELARARAARAEAEAKAQLVQKLLDEGGALDSSEDVLNSQLIQRLREREGALSAQIAELSTTLLPAHPRIRALEGQVDALEDQIRDETRKVLSSLQTAARVAAAREESLLGSLNDAKADVSRSNDQDIELRALEREAAAQRDLLESFLGRYREAAARTDSNYLPADARIISSAVTPEEPSFPKKKLMALAVAFALLLIGSAFVLLREFVSGRAFRTVEGRAEKPVLQSQAPSQAAAFVPPPPPPSSPSPPPPPPPGESAWHPAAPEPMAPMPAPYVVPPPYPAPLPILEPLPPLPPRPAWSSRLGEIFDTRAKRDSMRERLNSLRARTSREQPFSADFDELGGYPEERPPIADVFEKAESIPAAKPSATASANVEPEADDEASGISELGQIILNPSVRLVLFAGAEGGEGAGAVAFTTARQGAKQKLRCLLIDMGRAPSPVLGDQRPGLCDLLAGYASFGESIQRDETTKVHVISYGANGRPPAMSRLRLVLGALTHTYDKVILVADKLEDWPDEHVCPDVAAIVCAPEMSEASRTELYDSALTRGAKNAVIVRYTGDLDIDGKESAAA